MLYLIGLIFFSATYFLLGGETSDTLPRSLKELWNLAHIAYFFLLLYLIGYIPSLKSISAKILIPGLILFSLLLGGLIELCQYATGRTPDGQDIVLDLTGGLLALVFLGRFSKPFNRGLLLSFRIVLLTFLAVQSTPFAVAVVDEIIAYRQFPVLISNDTPFELDRWRGNSDIEIDRIESANLLKIRLSPEHRYPGTSLGYFPGDWSGYNLLVIRFYNPSPLPLNVSVRVHDRAHESSYSYQDRFNLNTRVQPGWSDLKIGLNQIRNAPQDREMNMREISDLSVFTNKLNKERVVYINKIYLSRKTGISTKK
ncbi:VanZ family protein [Draconibacterium sp.]|nr:VanZ family protein [Draconibacterium sp.]